jgi:hypothetical protein
MTIDLNLVNETDWFYKFWSDPIATFTGALFFATLVLVAIGYFQWRETRNTARRQLRAYISIYPGLLIEQDERSPAIFEARPTIKNTGQTPAYNVSFAAITKVLPYPLPNGFDLSLPPHPSPSVSTLGPQQDSSMFTYTEKIYPIDELIAILTMKGVALYPYGNVSYKDAFERTWETKFCYFFIWGSKGYPMWMLSNQNNKAT